MITPYVYIRNLVLFRIFLFSKISLLKKTSKRTYQNSWKERRTDKVGTDTKQTARLGTPCITCFSEAMPKFSVFSVLLNL